MEFIKNFLRFIGLLILGFIVFCLFITFTVMPFKNDCYNGNKIYEYEDINGNKGTASNCQYSDAGEYSRKGGQGQPICFVGKKVIAVKWYEDKTEYGNCFKMLGE